MSKRDHRRDSSRVRTFAGRRCFLSVAVNSLKFHIGRRQKAGTFVWVDPPWQFGKGNDLITTSADCPDGDSKRHESRFRKWCAVFSPLYQTTLEDATSSPDGVLTLKFSGGYKVVTSSDFIPSDQKLWYDHWYVSRHTRPNKTVQRTGATRSARSKNRMSSAAGSRR
jgi:hypothetical protein